MRNIRLTLSLLIILCFGSFTLAPALQASALQASAQQTIQSASAKPAEQMVAMRDGVKLSTIYYLPAGAGPFPVVLIRTPYGKGTQAIGNAKWTERGFALVVQDCRGKGQSEGAYHPFVEDPVDGYDTVEWVAKQPWSNGKVGMFGASAMGITSNLAAMMNPPHLVAIVCDGCAFKHLFPICFHGRRVSQRVERNLAQATGRYGCA